MQINYVSDNKTIQFAAEELKKYLEKISRNNITINLEKFKTVPENIDTNNDLCLGLISNISPQITIPSKLIPELDDYIAINVKENKGGIIGGNNPRSVLLAVYRYLTELGCRWVRPGPDGEIIPKKENVFKEVKIKESPDYRHRGICIEGAVSFEHVKNIIDWSPKVGFNSYFIQFREGYTFFERWYEHKNNPELEAEECSREKIRGYVDQLIKEIEKRDMIYQAVGHGWTCEPLGIPGLGWHQEESEVSAEVSRYLAEVDGERKLWNGVPLNTNLCYSQKEVRNMVIEEIADYIENHPEIDILHFWLADGSNNQCECEDCRQKRPSDFYVMMLNELDELLKERNLDTKIVFLIYVDLLWPPEEEEIKNEDRFILMFAPITRTYEEAFIPEKELPELPPFNRNELEFPEEVSGNIAFLDKWQDLFPGDSFDFDYHFMWAHYSDPGYMNISRVLTQDIKNLEDIGLNGFISCQTQRSFLPTGLGMTAMGWTLWDKTIEFEEIADDYFQAAFGGDWKQCQQYLTALSQSINLSWFKRENDEERENTLNYLNQIQKNIKEFKPIIKKNLSLENENKAQSWRYLKYHTDIISGLVKALTEKVNGNSEKAVQKWEKTVELTQKLETEIHSVFDVYLFIDTVSKIFNNN